MRSEVLVEAGDAFRVIAEVARRRDIDLVVMGAHRRRVLRDVFVGTTVERVMRTGQQPVLMVNAEPVEPYRRVLVAVDLSEASANALRTGKSLGFLDGVEVSIVHGFVPLAKGMMTYAGIEERKVEEHVAQSVTAIAGRLRAFLDAEGFGGTDWATLVEEGPPFDVIRRAVERLRPDLLVIGTRGQTGIKRLLLGSVADQVLREVECDVLAVPPVSRQQAQPPEGAEKARKAIRRGRRSPGRAATSVVPESRHRSDGRVVIASARWELAGRAIRRSGGKGARGA